MPTNDLSNKALTNNITDIRALQELANKSYSNSQQNNQITTSTNPLTETKTTTPEYKETTYTDPNGKQQIGYNFNGTTYTDKEKTSTVPYGSVVDTDGGQYIKLESGSQKYDDYLANQNKSYSETANQIYEQSPQYVETTYIDPNGKTQIGYNFNGTTYVDKERTSTVPYGSVVNTDGGQYIKLESGSQKYDDYKKQWNASNYENAPDNLKHEASKIPAEIGTNANGSIVYQTTGYDENRFMNLYLIDGQAYYDAEGKNPVNNNTVYYTQDGAVQKLENGSTIDYSPVQEAIQKYLNDEISEVQLDKIAQQVYGENYSSTSKGVVYSPTSITPQTVDLSGMTASDATEYIKEIYEKSAEAAIQELTTAKEKNIAEIDAEAAKLPALYQTYKNAAASQYELNKLNMNEYNAANGISSGAAAQMLLSMNNQYLSNLYAFEQKEAEDMAQLEMDRANLEIEYNNAVSQAVINNDLQKAQALYEEYLRQDEARIQAAYQQAEYDYKYYMADLDAYQFEAELAYQQEKDANNLALEYATLAAKNGTSSTTKISSGTTITSDTPITYALSLGDDNAAKEYLTMYAKNKSGNFDETYFDNLWEQYKNRKSEMVEQKSYELSDNFRNDIYSAIALARANRNSYSGQIEYLAYLVDTNQLNKNVAEKAMQYISDPYSDYNSTDLIDDSNSFYDNLF